jgi:hypothetical protein
MTSNEAFFIAAQTEVVPLAIGEPGTCKTRSIEAFAKSMNFTFESISLSQFEPTDVAGYPQPCHENGEHFVRMVLPEFVHRVQFPTKGTKSMFFLDELTTCSPATQAAALRWLTHGLGENVIICAAANPPECAANGYPLQAPMANRLYHHMWDNNFTDWSDGFCNGFPTKSYPILKDGWRQHIDKAKVFITAFLERHRTQFHKMPETDEARSKAWPSARSWTNASILLGAGISLGYDFSVESKNVHPIQAQFLTGCVGEGVQVEFFKWKNSLDLPHPEDILKNPSDFVIPKRNDAQMVIFSSLTQAILDKTTVTRMKAYVSVLERAFKEGYGGNVLFASKPVRDSQRKNSKAVGMFYENISPDMMTRLSALAKDLLNHSK